MVRVWRLFIIGVFAAHCKINPLTDSEKSFFKDRVLLNVISGIE